MFGVRKSDDGHVWHQWRSDVGLRAVRRQRRRDGAITTVLRQDRPRAKRRHGHTPGRRAVMTPDNFTYKSADGRQLAGYRWPARNGHSVAGVVVLVHGMGEHLRRYDHVAEALTLAGFVVYGHDHRGHGASLANGDEPGHLGPQGWPALVDDLNVVVAQAKSDHPGLPIVIVAHSMGSFATQQFLLDHGTDVDAVALTGTAALDLLEPALDLSSDLTCPRSMPRSNRRGRTSTGSRATSRSSTRISLIRCAASASTPPRPKTC